MDGLTLQIIPEYEGDGGRLGRHVYMDEKSRAFSMSMYATASKDVIHRRMVHPYNQAAIGKCTIEGLCGTVRTAEHRYLNRKQKASMSTEDKRTALYIEETAADAIPGQFPQEDTGSTVLDAMKLGVRHGWFSTYEWAFTADQAIAGINQSALEVGFNWYEGFDHPNQDGMVTIAGSVRGGHAFSVIGRVSTTKYGWVWICVQSWGPGWPINPFANHNAWFGIPDADFHRLREEQGEVARPVPLTALAA